MDFNNQKIYIIAEIGKNFIQTSEHLEVSDYLDNAKRLVNAASAAGVDAVKFQTHNVEDEQLKIHIESPHFNGNDRYQWVKRNTEATPLNEFWLPLKKYCDKIGITFFSTPMSRGAAQILNEIGVVSWKVGSADILDFVMLDYLATTKKPIIISSGMSTLEELDNSIAFLKKRKAEIALLHCVSCYPCPPEKLNLNAIPFLKKRYDITIGFSDHSLENESSLLACSMGAAIIEKHFTFSRDNWGPDHKASILPREMKELVKKIRYFEKDRKYINSRENIEKVVGLENKPLQKIESQFRPIFRKSLVAGKDIPANTIISPSMVYAMRPQKFINGLPSEDYEFVIGKRTLKDINKFEPINRKLIDRGYS